MIEIEKIIDGYNQEKLHLTKSLTAIEVSYYGQDSRIKYIQDCKERISSIDYKIDDIIIKLLAPASQDKE